MNLRKLALDVAPLALVAGAAIFESRHPAAQPRPRPRPGWRQVLVGAWGKIGRDQITMFAAGVTFYTLLALFPGLAAFVALYGLFLDVKDVPAHLDAVAFLLPSGSLDFVARQMLRLASAQKSGLSLAFALGLATSIWSANGAVKALMCGLNTAYEIRERRSFVRQTLISLALTLGLICFGIAATAALSLGPVISARAGDAAARAFNFAVYPALLAALVVALAVLYRYGPSRQGCAIHWFSWGALAATGLWLLVSALFSVYVGNFAHYDRMYGSFGAVVGFIFWLYLSNIIVLLGGELNAQIEGPCDPVGR